jgi:tetratricopeptide (TPR) repeat protein
MDASLAPLCAKWGLETGLDPVAGLRTTVAGASPDETKRDELITRLERDVAADPTDVTARLELERFRAESGKTEEALRAVRRVKQSLAADPNGVTVQQMEEATVLEAWCLARLGRDEELDALIRDYHAKFQESPNSLFLAGIAARAAGDTPVAARRFRRALAMECLPGWMRSLPEVAGPVLPTMLGLACIDGGEFEMARAAFDTALRRDLDNLEAELGRLAATYGEGAIETVLHELDRLAEAHGDDPKVWISGGILLGQFPQLAPVAVEWLEEACRRIPGNAELVRRLGEAQLRCGRGEAALETWSSLDASDPAMIPARVAACLVSGVAVGKLASGGDAELENGVLLWFQRWAASGAWDALERALTDLPGAGDVLPGLVESTAAWLERGGQHETARRLRSGEGAEV